MKSFLNFVFGFISIAIIFFMPFVILAIDYFFPNSFGWQTFVVIFSVFFSCSYLRSKHKTYPNIVFLSVLSYLSYFAIRHLIETRTYLHIDTIIVIGLLFVAWEVLLVNNKKEKNYLNALELLMSVNRQERLFEIDKYIRNENDRWKFSLSPLWNIRGENANDTMNRISNTIEYWEILENNVSDHIFELEKMNKNITGGETDKLASLLLNSFKIWLIYIKNQEVYHKNLKVREDNSIIISERSADALKKAKETYKEFENSLKQTDIYFDNFKKQFFS